MTLPEMIDKLTNSGFIVTWNDDHDTAFVNLYNRVPSTMEVIRALGFQPMRIVKAQDCVQIQE